MNRALSLGLLFVAALLVAGSPALHKRVVLTVTESGKTDYAKKITKKSKEPEIKSARFLAIAVRDGAGRAREGLVVRHYIFATDMEKNETVIVSKGEQTVSVAALGTTEIETKPVRLSYSPEHSVGSRKQSTQVDDTGFKYLGYAVQVYEAGELVAESYDPLVLKSQVNTARVEKPGAKKKSSKKSSN